MTTTTTTASTTRAVSIAAPDLTAVLDNLFIGNLASATTLDKHPELGITHVLSVCPDYPEESASASASTSTSSGRATAAVARPVHRCIPVQDSECEDILTHLPSAVAFIRDALEAPRGRATGAERPRSGDGEDLAPDPPSNRASIEKHKVLVHCVMGISRSTTVVCAYLMSTRRMSPAAALLFVKRRRAQAHPNYGFRRQLAIFADCGYFENHRGSVRSHPAHAAWWRRRNHEARRYLARVDDVVEIKLANDENVSLSITDDFPTDSTEAASLLSEVEATHFLTISPASMPVLPPSHPSPVASPALRPFRRPPPSVHSPVLSAASSSDSSSGLHSAFSSPPSSRSSSFSSASHLSSSSSSTGPSTAATSCVSLPPCFTPSKLRSEASSEGSDDDVDVEEEEEGEEPTFLALARVKHYHLEVSSTSPADLLFRLNEGASFIRRAAAAAADDAEGFGVNSSSEQHKHKHVLIHCTKESRACAVVCAYVMSARGLSPLQAYNFIEEALPLFNPTKSFLKQLELYHACGCQPVPEHPAVRTWLASSGSGSGVPKSIPKLNSGVSSSSGARRPGPGLGMQWKGDSDAEGDFGDVDRDGDRTALRKKLGTPARCGSFAVQQGSNTNANANTSPSQSSSSVPRLRMPTTGERKGSGSSGVDVEKLLERCAGVGDPEFAFDVEAFRGALRGIVADADRRTG
ncbi:hypothetical protein M0805_000377 [Coniferiporia weirii]|nr:hypothetical protein M0805_000377 [Coniferiporia weirii]